MKKLFFMVVFSFSFTAFAEYTSSDLIQCAKWLMGSETTQNFDLRKEAVKVCAHGVSVECAKFVMGSDDSVYNTYQNRVEAALACSTRPQR